MHSSLKSSSHSNLQTLTKVLLYTFALLVLTSQSVTAQNFITPVIDGVIHAQQLEYGNNEEDHDRRTSGPVTWWITWDDNNFYIATNGAPVAESAVCYFDSNPIVPSNGGTNANGTLTGINSSGARFATLPFRADFVANFSTAARSWQTSDHAGGWGPAVGNGGTFASVGGQREYGIPWNAINAGSGRPTSFLFMCYGVAANGNIGTNATATYFYRIYNSIDPINKPPFSIISNSNQPTAAEGSVSGKVTFANGRPIMGAQVTLLGGDGIFRVARTSPFGYYTLTDVPVGGSYILQVESKSVSAPQSRIFQFLEDVNDADFIFKE